jgi:hypothetical protein
MEKAQMMIFWAKPSGAGAGNCFMFSKTFPTIGETKPFF